MNTYKVERQMPEPAPCVATIGMFDGVHRGHQYLISRVRAEATKMGLQSTVITFDSHPRQVLQSDYIPQLLSPLDVKLMLLARTGVDNCALLHFDREMASLSAYEFMEKVLRDRLNVRKLVIGYDNRFGHNRSEGFDDYVRYGRQLGIEVVHNQAFTLNGINVSSSVVRSFIAEGEIELANTCLGYPYTLVGRVVDGYHEGHKLGYPTANLDTCRSGQLIPANGVYAAKARLQHSMAYRQGMTDIGTRPTFDGKNRSIETHIFDFNEDIYGQTLLVALVHRIRGERKFSSAEQLTEQLHKDEEMVKNQFLKDTDNE